MFTLIINPVSGGSKALRTLPEIEAILKTRNIEYGKLVTSLPLDAQQFASVPCGADDTVAVVGGDGTVFDVLNHLPALDMTLIYVPCGTGNDFIKCLKLPSDPVRAFLQQLDGVVRRVDLCSANGYRFINICGAGFDVDVLRKLSEYRIKYTGLKAYLLSVICAVKEYKPFKCRVAFDEGELRDAKFTLISIGNGQFFGGGMKAVPGGDPFDGYLDIVEVDAVKKWQICVLLPLFVFGKHINLGFVRTHRCKSVHIECEGMTVQLDGELCNVPVLKAGIWPQALKIRI